ncbi:MAG: T9SS type A sorting domain-containing protein [Bacteroidota bacterium]
MKRFSSICLGLVGLLMAVHLPAQHNFEFNNEGALIVTSAAAEIYVWGDVHQEGSTATLNHNGLLEVQGNMFSDGQFQQRGTGTVRLENNDINSGERQFIQGSYAVRGGQSQIGTDDGSFYNLELANTQGAVHLLGTGVVADVRNAVDFNPAGAAGSPPVNRIVTHDTLTLPTNGSGYLAVFGMMNPAPGLGSFVNNSVALGGNMSATDVGYVQGNLRRAIGATGGAYGYLEGLEPAGASAARGFQYILLDFGVNNYDVVTSYYEQGSPNSMIGTPSECGYNITYFAGVDHGEWMFSDLNGNGSGTYEVVIWPQDGIWPVQSTWFITKDNAIQGTLGDCGPTTTGLDRAAFNGFQFPSEFDFAGGSIILDANELIAGVRPIDNRYFEVHWTNPEEVRVADYEVQRSEDAVAFLPIGREPATGNDGALHKYMQADHNVQAARDYYYRIMYVDRDGNSGYSNAVRARLDESSLGALVEIFPVPVSSEGLTIRTNLPEGRPFTFTVYDAIGKLVHAQEIEVAAGLSERIIATQDWSQGTYFVHLQSGTESLVKQVIRR